MSNTAIENETVLIKTDENDGAMETICETTEVIRRQNISQNENDESGDDEHVLKPRGENEVETEEERDTVSIHGRQDVVVTPEVPLDLRVYKDGHPCSVTPPSNAPSLYPTPPPSFPSTISSPQSTKFFPPNPWSAFGGHTKYGDRGRQNIKSCPGRSDDNTSDAVVSVGSAAYPDADLSTWLSGRASPSERRNHLDSVYTPPPSPSHEDKAYKLNEDEMHPDVEPNRDDACIHDNHHSTKDENNNMTTDCDGNKADYDVTEGSYPLYENISPVCQPRSHQTRIATSLEDGSCYPVIKHILASNKAQPNQVAPILDESERRFLPETGNHIKDETTNEYLKAQKANGAKMSNSSTFMRPWESPLRSNTRHPAATVNQDQDARLLAAANSSPATSDKRSAARKPVVLPSSFFTSGYRKSANSLTPQSNDPFLQRYHPYTRISPSPVLPKYRPHSHSNYGGSFSSTIVHPRQSSSLITGSSPNSTTRLMHSAPTTVYRPDEAKSDLFPPAILMHRSLLPTGIAAQITNASSVFGGNPSADMYTRSGSRSMHDVNSPNPLNSSNTNTICHYGSTLPHQNLSGRSPPLATNIGLIPQLSSRTGVASSSSYQNERSGFPNYFSFANIRASSTITPSNVPPKSNATELQTPPLSYNISGQFESQPPSSSLSRPGLSTLPESTLGQFRSQQPSATLSRPGISTVPEASLGQFGSQLPSATLARPGISSVPDVSLGQFGSQQPIATLSRPGISTVPEVSLGRVSSDALRGCGEVLQSKGVRNMIHSVLLANDAIRKIMANSTTDSVNGVNHPSQKRKQPRALCAFASQLLNKWFRMNIVHPYPSKSEAEELAQLAGITDAQVRKWMANKRMRSGNTMPSLSKRSRSRLRPSDLLKGRSIGQLGGGTINVGAVPMQNDIMGEGRVKDGVLKSEIK